MSIDVCSYFSASFHKESSLKVYFYCTHCIHIYQSWIQPVNAFPKRYSYISMTSLWISKSGIVIGQWLCDNETWLGTGETAQVIKCSHIHICTNTHSHTYTHTNMHTYPHKKTDKPRHTCTCTYTHEHYDPWKHREKHIQLWSDVEKFLSFW